MDRLLAARSRAARGDPEPWPAHRPSMHPSTTAPVAGLYPDRAGLERA